MTARTFDQNDLRIFAHTRDAISQRIFDHVFSKSPTTAIFLGQMLGDFGSEGMNGVGHMTQTGGYAIIVRVELGEQTGFKWKAGPFDTHNVDADDNTQYGEANWKFASHNLTISGHDERTNRGPEAISSFIEHQTNQTVKSLANQVAKTMHESSAVTSGFARFDELISAGDTAQGLSGLTYDPEYNSRGLSPRGTAASSISFTSGSFATQGISDMRRMVNNCTEGTVAPNVILTTYDTHERYEGALQPQERFQGAVSVADGSFGALAFRTIPVMADPDVITGPDHMYALRAGDDGIGVIALDGADIDFGDFKLSNNQDVAVSELMLTGNLVIRHRSHGSNKMTGITD